VNSLPNKLTKENERLLRIAQEALEECNTLYETTGKKKIPLDDVAKNLIVNKEEIQHGFDILVEMGVIGDDGDRDHMNYDEDGALMEFIEQLLRQSAPEEEEEEEKDAETPSPYSQPE
jgi:hypothetical protein